MEEPMLKIITDSASDMPQYIVERFNLHVIPTPVVIDGVDYLDGATIHTKDFYEILDDVSRDIKTYHINPAMFEEAFRPYAEHNDSVIYLCFSTGIAGTFNAANIAKQNILEDYPDFDLTIVDSKSAAIGFGLIVYKLLLLREAGADKEKLLRAADFYVNHIQHVFTVSTLRYLIKGGRLSKWKGTAGELLDMKPVLIVDKDGSLQVFDTSKFTCQPSTDGTYQVDADGHVTSCYAFDLDGDFVNDEASGEAIVDGAFQESVLRSAPYFALRIDGITELNNN